MAFDFFFTLLLMPNLFFWIKPTNYLKELKIYRRLWEAVMKKKLIWTIPTLFQGYILYEIKNTKNNISHELCWKWTNMETASEKTK